VSAARLWRVVIDLRGLRNRALDASRTLVVTDVLRRVLEDLQGGQVFLAMLTDDAPRIPDPGLLQVRDPLGRVASWDAAVALVGGAADVVVESAAADSTASPQVAADRRLRVAGVTGPDDHTDGMSDLPVEDPLATRLALLRVPYDEPAALSLARMHRADETLQRWRLKVAGWADMPSAPPTVEHLESARRSLESGLDTRSVLTLLHRVEVDHRLPSGSKFETFAQIDRMLALDLCRLVGKLPR